MHYRNLFYPIECSLIVLLLRLKLTEQHAKLPSILSSFSSFLLGEIYCQVRKVRLLISTSNIRDYSHPYFLNYLLDLKPSLLEILQAKKKTK
jgi:hypothetical protein